MPRTIWASREDVVLVYYSSRDVPFCIVADLVQLKCSSQYSSAQCSTRLASINTRERDAGRPTLRGSYGWNLNAVDQWLDRQRIPEGAAAFLTYDDDAKAIVLDVRNKTFLGGTI